MTAFNYTNQTVLITGASSGIGRVFAETLAARGAHLLLLARSGAVLDSLATELVQRHGIRAHALVADLSLPGAAAQAHRQACALGMPPDVLINNAGFATHGRFESINLARQASEVTVNCTALMELTHCALPHMLAQGRGAIINVASTAALQPDPYMAVYGASKAFVLSFSEALWAENRQRGVRVLALCPGATDTAFFDVVAAPEAAVGQRMAPQAVVDEALRALDRGRSNHVAGRPNRLLAWLPRLLPRQTVLGIVEGMLKPKAA
ncbi:SDR family NAD(P)-dependent oxidoreductase [Janthinobacterium sp. RB2P8]|uniref:SDR family NAD(P)-dependent oxidoreductase n=1 Tax=Janthinobacterium sp. RB2P8 TaxID=3424191 RepID=UPI003F26B79D